MSQPTEAAGRPSGGIVARTHDVMRRGPWFAPLLAGLALFAFYYATAPGNRTEADDAFWYACLVRQGTLRSQIAAHSSHLLYLPLMTSIYRFAKDAGIMLSSYDLLRLISSIAAAATGMLFYLLLRERLGVGFQASLASTAGLCASYGFWRYVNEAEVYAPAAALIVLGLWFALGDTRTHLAGAVVVFAVATFISILSLLPALIVVPFLIGRRHGFRTATVYVASLSLVVATIAYATYQRVEHGTSSFLAFVNPPSSATSNWIAAAAQSVVGFGQSVVARKFLLTKPSVLDLMEREFPTKVFQEERFLAAHTSLWMATFPFATLAILLVSLVLRGVLLLRAPRDPRGCSHLLLLFVAWILGYWLVAIRVDPGAPRRGR